MNYYWNTNYIQILMSHHHWKKRSMLLQGLG